MLTDTGKMLRAEHKRTVPPCLLNAPATRTYLVSAWGKIPVGYTSNGSNMKYNNATYERFFGIIAKIYYAGYSTPECQYIAFNCALGGWQYTTGLIVPKETSRTVERIELDVTGDLLPNDAYVDDVTLIQDPVQSYTYDDKGNLLSATNSEGKTSTETDNKDRLTKYTAMNGVVYSLKYNGDSRNPSTITSDGVTTSYTYDAGNVTQTKTQGSDGSYLESTTGYDATKNFAVSSTDTNGAVSTKTYDVSKGQVLTSKTPRGQETVYSYNDDDRILSSNMAGARLYYNYYENGQTSQINRNGAARWQGYRFQYDVWGNTTEIQVGQPADGTANSLSSATTLAKYTYDSAGKMTKMEYPNGQYVTYDYDSLDRLVSEKYYN